jgi:hypothetical protein
MRRVGHGLGHRSQNGGDLRIMGERHGGLLP